MPEPPGRASFRVLVRFEYAEGWLLRRSGAQVPRVVLNGVVEALRKATYHHIPDGGIQAGW
ncbi:MAG: hypothetical protein ACP5FH_07405 [Terracidiphilus sp.]